MTDTDEQLIAWVLDARARTRALTDDLDDAAMLGPKLRIVNPPLWEIGHVAWFAEKWVLRHAAGHAPLRADADALYDSAAVAHDTRWDLPLPSRRETEAYLDAVRDAVVARIREPAFADADRYFVRLAVFHEDMHDEAFLYTRQTLGHAVPSLMQEFAPEPTAAPAPADDASIAGGSYVIGADRDETGFVFDNEKWAHRVDLKPFKMARTQVTQGEFARFVDDGGYRRDELWSEAGRAWRQSVQAQHPVYWQKAGTTWNRRVFDRWIALEADKPVVHVSWFEADAYCRWAGRRLPTEAEWEVAASTAAGERARRRHPWGDAPWTPALADLGARHAVAADAGAHPLGASARGVVGLFGGTWEWCVDDFAPYPGFVEDPYKEYSAPWFGNHKVLRGGAYVTQPRLLRNTWRNFYTPDRRDVWAGFRTCAVEE